MPYRLALGILWSVLALGTDLLALDTLRVGNNGNVSWAGQTFGSAVQSLPAEYKVSRFSTEVGNVPGNVIDLSNLAVVSPQVLVKTLIQAPPELLAGEVALAEEKLLDAVSSLPGATAVTPSQREGLSLIRLDFADYIPLDEAVAQVAAALAPVRSASFDPLILPVLLSPDHVVRGENVAQRALGWGGGITAPAIKDVPASTLEAILLELIEPGGAEDAFVRKGVFGALGTFIVLDLGSPIGINRIRFYPRNTVQSAPQYPFQTDFIRQFELLAHDGQDLVLDGTGRFVPQLDDFEMLLKTSANEESVVELVIDPAQTARFVRLKSTSSFPYELDEFEVFGEGFIGTSRYISHVYDLGAPATWGNISWREKTVDLRLRSDLTDLAPQASTCRVKSAVFATPDDIPSDYGDCGPTARFTADQGYTNVYECFQTHCGETVLPGRQQSTALTASESHDSGVSEIIVRTRTGTDPTPVLYKRGNVQRVSDDQLATSLDSPDEQLARDEYLDLEPNLEAVPPQVWGKGEIEEDLQNWSPWSSPHQGGEREGGTPVCRRGRAATSSFPSISSTAKSTRLRHWNS